MSTPQAQLPPGLPRPSPNPATIIIMLLTMTLLLALGWYFVAPNSTVTPPDTTETKVILGDKVLDTEVLFEGEEILLPVQFVQTYIDPSLHWDAAEQQLIVTTRDKVLTMKTDQLTALLNNEEIKLDVPATWHQDQPYMPLMFLQELYNIRLTHQQETNRLTVDFLGKPLQQLVVTRDSVLRYGPSKKEPIISKLAKGEELTFLSEKDNWYHVGSTGGILGFVNEKDVELSGIKFEPLLTEPVSPPFDPLGGKLNLTWEQVDSRNPDVAVLPSMPGLNIVSPTWFYLKDSEGTIGNRADISYANWAHARGYQVWGLASNNFNPQLTHQVLQSTQKRFSIINQLLAFAELYNLDGINVDFENMLLEDKDLLIQFMRELVPLAHEQGLTVSIDVSVISQSEQWSQIYDRKALASAVDYVMVMTYDEHWGGSPKAGSVASLPWVEQSLKRLLQEIPAKKLVLGVPFYTRLWEETSNNGQSTVTSRALSMDEARNLVKQNGADLTFDEKTGQDYATWTRAGKTYEIWLENSVSMEQRIQLVKKYDLAGIASWSRRWSESAIWETIATTLAQRP